MVWYYTAGNAAELQRNGCHIIKRFEPLKVFLFGDSLAYIALTALKAESCHI